MTRIAILSGSVSESDAVSNDVLGMRRALAARGHNVEVFAETINVTRPAVRHISQALSFLRQKSDLLIYHHASGWSRGLAVLEKARCRRVVKYHNVTPPEYFEGFAPDEYSRVCAAGREETASIAQLDCNLYLSDSTYNQSELLDAGANASASCVVPPFHHTNRLTSIDAELETLDKYRDGSQHILAVGRVAPNKRHDALIRTFATYQCGYNRNSRLVIVGHEDPRLRLYNGYLRGLADGLGVLDAVVFTGKVSDRVLKAFYLLADVFLTTSDHEGFCVPLIEAMAMKVPVVAYGSTAIPETVGGAGLVWDEADPQLLAESVDAVTRSDTLRQDLGMQGWHRYQRHFTNEKIEEVFLKALDGLL